MESGRWPRKVVFPASGYVKGLILPGWDDVIHHIQGTTSSVIDYLCSQSLQAKPRTSLHDLSTHTSLSICPSSERPAKLSRSQFRSQSPQPARASSTPAASPNRRPSPTMCPRRSTRSSTVAPRRPPHPQLVALRYRAPPARDITHVPARLGLS